MRLEDFSFDLPAALIAQEPAAQRDQSRLMVIERTSQRICHDVFANIGRYFQAGDVLVVNDTRVIPARLRGSKTATGGKVEVFLGHEIHSGVWEVLVRPAARVAVGTEIVFGEGILRGQVVERRHTGSGLMAFTPTDIRPLLEHCGEVPLPPYIKRTATSAQARTDAQRYQTVYAQHPGAVAAPTAGLHFTPALLEALAQQGVARAAVTLHVGWGTFQPVRVERVEEHRMEKEWYRLTSAEAARILQAQQAGGRVVAVGTTATRTLETIVRHAGKITAHSGWSDLFIFPGYHFQAIDALLTNFHLPQSTLFLLVCAFAGQALMQEAYRLAIAERYRFYSYGDAMLIQ